MDSETHAGDASLETFKEQVTEAVLPLAHHTQAVLAQAERDLLAELRRSGRSEARTARRIRWIGVRADAQRAHVEHWATGAHFGRDRTEAMRGDLFAAKIASRQRTKNDRKLVERAAVAARAAIHGIRRRYDLLLAVQDDHDFTDAGAIGATTAGVLMLIYGLLALEIDQRPGLRDRLPNGTYHEELKQAELQVERMYQQIERPVLARIAKNRGLENDPTIRYWEGVLDRWLRSTPDEKR